MSADNLCWLISKVGNITYITTYIHTYTNMHAAKSLYWAENKLCANNVNWIWQKIWFGITGVSFHALSYYIKLLCIRMFSYFKKPMLGGIQRTARSKCSQGWRTKLLRNEYIEFIKLKIAYTELNVVSVAKSPYSKTEKHHRLCCWSQLEA